MPLYLDRVPAEAADLPPALAAPLDWCVALENGEQAVPNVSEWQAGDILLVSRHSRNGFTADMIEEYQRSCTLSYDPTKQMPARAAATVHVAIFDGDVIWQLVPRRPVQRQTVAEFFDHQRCYAIGRMMGLEIDGDLLTRYLERGIRTESHAIPVDTILGILLPRWRGQQPRADLADRLRISSTYVMAAILFAAGDAPVHPYLLPADYSANPECQRLDVKWAAPPG